MAPAYPAKYRSAAELCPKKGPGRSQIRANAFAFRKSGKNSLQTAEALASRLSATSRLYLPKSTQ